MRQNIKYDLLNQGKKPKNLIYLFQNTVVIRYTFYYDDDENHKL